MDTFFIPPSPNWFLTQILACAPDNTLIYGSKNDIIIIHPTPEDQSPKIEILPDEGCYQKVVCVDVTPKWDTPNKWILSSWEDNVVKIWDMKKLLWKKCSPPSKIEKDNLVGSRFLTEDRILNVFESGAIVICHVPLMKYTHLSNVIMGKVSVTCFAPCPHSSHIAAFGLKNGLIIIADLRKNGTLLHKLRGHTGEVLNLCWCPAPINIFPQKPGNLLKITDIDNVANESNITVNIEKELKGVEITEIPSISPCTEESENVNSGTIIKLNAEDKKDIEEANPTNVEEAIVDKITISEHNLLIEKIENLIIESEEKPVELEFEVITVEQKSVVKLVEHYSEKKSVEHNSEEKSVEHNSEEKSLEHNSEEKSLEHNSEEKSLEHNSEEKSLEHNSEEKSVEQEYEVIAVEDKSEENSVEQNCEEKSEQEFEVISVVKQCEENSAEHKSEETSVEQKSEEKDGQKSFEKVQEEKHSLNATEKQCSNSEKVEKISINPEDKQSLGSNETSFEESKPCKSIITPVFEEPRKELLLASSGRDSSINIWRAGTDGRLQFFFRIPEKKNYNRNKKSNNNTWIALKWISPFSILVGTTKGELVKYVLPRPLDGKKESTVVHHDHSSFIFVIAAHVPILTEENWFVEKETKIWTFSHDLFLLNTILDSKITHLISIETFSALVNCMAHSLVDPNRIALGLSNGTVKIWNANNSSGKCFSTANYSPKIYGKITCLDWHPVNELVIAFSTEEGTVGLLSTTNKYKATWFQQYFASAVHKIQWAPYKGKTCLYAIGKGNLVCFDPDDTKQEPKRIELSSDIVPYSFSWKLDMTLMLVSTNCGKIICYDSDLTVKATYYNNKKTALMLWHPDSEVTTTPRSFWVASALDNVVCIFDFAEVVEKKGTLNIEDIVRTKIDVHYGNIKSMAWNQFDGDQLVTAGEDGLAHVLNVNNGTILASYCDNRFSPIKAIMWSPIREDLLIMTMSKCPNLISWNLSNHKGPLSSDVLKECENHFKNSRKINLPPSQKDEESGKKVKKIMKSAKTVILPGSVDNGEEKIKTLRAFLEGEGNDNSTEESSNIQKLFGTKNDVLNLLSSRETSHIGNQKFEAAATVSLFKGDLQSHIVEAIEQYRVTPLLISLAPSVSMSLWQKACETYAGQVAAKPDADPLEVAQYFLACQNIEKAIEYLCEKEMFKEAVALAKVRLPHDSVIVDDVVLRWAKFSSFCGNMETAALCYMKLGKHEEAVNMLFRRNDSDILGIALDLAKKTGNAELIKAVEFRYNAFSKNDKIETEASNEILEKDINVKAEENHTSTEVFENTSDALNGQISIENTSEVDKHQTVTQAEIKIIIEDENEIVIDSLDITHDVMTTA